jgi:hypothetical protein
LAEVPPQFGNWKRRNHKGYPFPQVEAKIYEENYVKYIYVNFYPRDSQRSEKEGPLCWVYIVHPSKELTR